MVPSSPSKSNDSRASDDQISSVMKQATFEAASALASLPIGSPQPSPFSGTKQLISHHAGGKPEKSAETSSPIPIKNKNKGKSIAYYHDDVADGDGEASGSNSCTGLLNASVDQKPWNLRPRKEIRLGGGAVMNNGGLARMEMRSPKSRRTESPRVRAGADAKMAAETKEKMRLSISLTKEEIEHDFIQMTGAKPSRKPRRRNKRVQKDMDNFFPGGWLESPIPEMYKVSDKRKM